MSRGLVMTVASVGIAVGILVMILGNLWIGLAVIAAELLFTVPYLAMDAAREKPKSRDPVTGEPLDED